MAPQGQSEASSEVGFYVALAPVLVVVIICFACCTGSSKRKKETLGKDDEEVQQDRNSENKRLRKDSLEIKNETLGQEKEDLQKQNDHLKRENKKLVKDSLKIVKDELVKENETLQKQNETLKQEKEKVEAEKKDLQKQNETLKQEKEKVEAEKEDLQKQNEIYKEEVEADFEELRRKTNTCGYVLDREWKTIIKVHVNVTLDPDTATPSLTVSEDGSRVRFTGERSAEWPSVLGRKGFTSGSHYWEVEVGEKGYWVLGVSTHPPEKSIPEKPEEGYWLVRLVRGKTCTSVSQSGEKILNLEKICKVWGVYLDHKGGRLSFYNAETRFHIHTLEGSFPGQVYPIFSPGSHDKGPLIINATVKNV